MMSISDEAIPTPAWVRGRDGSQSPFEADRICQSLFLATEELGAPNAFLARELTDVVLHFLAQEFLHTIPTTLQIVEQVEKVVRAVGHSSLARCYSQMHDVTSRQDQEAMPESSVRISIAAEKTPDEFVQQCLQSYSLNIIYSPDLRSAVTEGLLHLSGLNTPATLSTVVVDARPLGDESWWLSWEPWKSCGARWIVDSPEWLSILLADRLPMVRLCERIVALPHVAHHAVELHLNTLVPPQWVHAQVMGPLFTGNDNPLSLSHRVGCLDMLLDRCLAMSVADAPVIAWHLNQESFQDATQLAQLKILVRQAVQGKAIRFFFDRLHERISLSDGFERPCPGILLEVGLDLEVFARRPEIAQDSSILLKKLPSLARMAITAVVQKRRYLRSMPDHSPVKQGFLIERSVGNIIPLKLSSVVHSITGQSMEKSPIALEFGMNLLQTLKDACRQESRSMNLELTQDYSPGKSLPERESVPALSEQLKTASLLHSRIGSGTVTLLLAKEAETRIDHLISLFERFCRETSITRLQLQRIDAAVLQGEFSIEPLTGAG